jgi:ceramide glucosyltransferase
LSHYLADDHILGRLASNHGFKVAISGYVVENIVAILLRIWMHFAVRRKLGLRNGLRSVWLVPVRDILCFAVWGASFLSRKIDWKGATFMVGPGGAMNVTDGRGA